MKEEIEILHREKDFAIVVKPFLMLSQRDEKGEEGLYELLKKKWPDETSIELLQRLDRVAGGLICISLNAKFSTHFRKLQEKRAISKGYLTVVEGKPEIPSQRLEAFLAKVRGSNRRRVFENKRPNAKRVILDYEFLTEKDGKSLVRVHPITGRTHQIRVQLAGNGMGIAGDKKYAKTNWLADKSISLYSYSLAFEDLKGEKRLYKAPYPTFHELFSLFEEPELS